MSVNGHQTNKRKRNGGSEPAASTVAGPSKPVNRSVRLRVRVKFYDDYFAGLKALGATVGRTAPQDELWEHVRNVFVELKINVLERGHGVRVLPGGVIEFFYDQDSRAGFFENLTLREATASASVGGAPPESAPTHEWVWKRAKWAVQAAAEAAFHSSKMYVTVSRTRTE
jgi:hypothetical protein